MKKYYTALAFVLFLFTANSQSIQYYSNCVDYYGDASNQSNETNVEFINRIFGVNYSSIPSNTNPGHITGSFLGCRASLSSCQDRNCNSTSAANPHKG
ncbi:MAG: hypothetical protein K1X82_07120, partial [Bacteroidia bacterium]|nr:hypothetical protein [Bacteroidia bacterium]